LHFALIKKSQLDFYSQAGFFILNEFKTRNYGVLLVVVFVLPPVRFVFVPDVFVPDVFMRFVFVPVVFVPVVFVPLVFVPLVFVPVVFVPVVFVPVVLVPVVFVPVVFVPFVLMFVRLVLALFAVLVLVSPPQAEMPTAKAATAEMVKTFNFMVF
jgi:hypothetical protein